METNVGFGDVHLQHSLSRHFTPDPAHFVGRPLSMANLRGFENFWIFNLWLDLLYNLIRIVIYLWLDLLYNFTEIAFIYDLIYLIICPKSMHLHLDLFDNLSEIGYIYPKRHSKSARVPPFRGACDLIRPCLSSRRPQAIFLKILLTSLFEMFFHV